MASPQKENGYTAIANEILEALVKVRIPASEKDICFFVIRKTYGYNKKEDKISLTQFELGTGLSRVTVVKALKNLLTREIMLKRGSLFRLNKDYEKWVVNAGLLVKSENIFGKGGYTKNGKGGYTHKRQKTITKDNTTFSKEKGKNSLSIKSMEINPKEISEIIKSFESVNPACKSFYQRKPQRTACAELISLYGFDRIKSVIELTLPKTNRMEYFPTITTPIQLRDKWVSLESAIMKYKSKHESKIKKNKVAF